MTSLDGCYFSVHVKSKDSKIALLQYKMCTYVQEYWSGLPFPTPGDFLYPGVEPASPESPALTGRFFTTVPPGKHYRSH